MPPRQLSRSTLALIILLSLLCALSWKLWESIQRSRALILERELTARAFAATLANTTGQRVTISRPWVKLSDPPQSLFDFTDSEWQTLTNAFADKLSPLVPEQLVFAEGAVTRVTTARLKELSTSENVQTNAVWFLH